ncbi:hypothetical protein ACT3SZ_06595 [Corynebacterium sp. AOP40-9SA-29]|uniref:hypothetical protein n=1 Tax=Corynebacterium sp. AOP40-9SA-29 TaxID=3457677 RepID=UPI004034AC39
MGRKLRYRVPLTGGGYAVMVMDEVTARHDYPDAVLDEDVRDYRPVDTSWTPRTK